VGKLFAWGCALLMAVSVAAAKEHPGASQRNLVTRGKYLVENVTMCNDCHSPRDEKGEFIPSRHLEGAPLFFAPLHPIPNWAAASPPVAGLRGWTSAEAIKFFMTGVDRNGQHAGPPMPQYRMSRRDAEGVVAYLKSLRAGQE
jgi:mono/diheme cytochrome c family protein